MEHSIIPEYDFKNSQMAHGLFDFCENRYFSCIKKKQ